MLRNRFHEFRGRESRKRRHQFTRVTAHREGAGEAAPRSFHHYSGNNEVVGPYGPGTALTSSAISLPVIRTSILAAPLASASYSLGLGSKRNKGRGWRRFSSGKFPPVRRCSRSSVRELCKQPPGDGGGPNARSLDRRKHAPSFLRIDRLHGSRGLAGEAGRPHPHANSRGKVQPKDLDTVAKMFATAQRVGKPTK
jgi:hypothetical protein